MAKHVFGRTHLDLIVSDPLENRPLVLITLGRDLTEAPNAAVFNRGVNRERKDHANTVWQEPLGVLANDIKRSAGFSLVNNQGQRVFRSTCINGWCLSRSGCLSFFNCATAIGSSLVFLAKQH